MLDETNITDATQKTYDQVKISELTQKLYELKMETNSIMLELTGSMYSTSERDLSLSENDLQRLADKCDLIGDDFKDICSELTLQTGE